MRKHQALLGVAALALGLSMSVPASAAGLGEKCGGFIGIACEAGLWCQNAANQCSVADGFGTCARVPAVCAQIYQPVCGCNGKTYGNDCERQAARAQLAHAGPCK